MEKIFEKLVALRTRSYSPYSNFGVSCLIVLHNGVEINGVNIENAAYGAVICGERSAIASLISQGFTKEDVKAIYLYTDSHSFGTPCGICRQVLSEMIGEDQQLIIFNQTGKHQTFTIGELLPYSFTKNSLK